MLSKLLWLLCLVVLVLYGDSCVVVYWFECLFLVGCVVELWVAYWLGDLARVVLVLVFVVFGLLLF